MRELMINEIKDLDKFDEMFKESSELVYADYLAGLNDKSLLDSFVWVIEERLNSHQMDLRYPSPW